MESIRFGDLAVYWLKGIGQVFLIDSWVTGIWFLAGLFLCSRWAALWAAIRSALALLTVVALEKRRARTSPKDFTDTAPC
ncbi:MAG: urea transporter [Alistipes senegalensis]